MLDTVVLNLHGGQFKVNEYENFIPSARGFFEPPYLHRSVKCRQNPRFKNEQESHYFPRLTLFKANTFHSSKLILKVEFSAPKLLFGNNFEELVESDYEKLKTILCERLLVMGVETCLDSIDRATVSGIHYSKNFLLMDGTSCRSIIYELQKASLSKRLDLCRSDYLNDGCAVRFHANNHETIFYDKLRDLKQARISVKRALERDYFIQVDFLKKNALPKGAEVLRMEVRLGTRKKIKHLLSKLLLGMEETFFNLFSQKNSSAVLLHFWELLERDLDFLGMAHHRSEDVFRKLLRKGKRPRKALELIGGINTMREIGIMGLRSLFGTVSNGVWQRFKKEVEGWDQNENGRAQIFHEIRRAIQNYLPLRIDCSPVSEKDIGTGGSPK